MRILVLFLLLLTSPATAATLYVDGNLASDCTSGNYSIASRNCSGAAGKAYRAPALALTASSASDTILVRAGTYVLSASIFPKAGQTWQRYLSETVIIDGGNGAADRAFHISNVANVTIDGFIIRNTGFQGIWATVATNGGTCTNTTIQNNTVSLWNWQNQNYYAAIKYSRCQGGLITNNTIGNPKNGVAQGHLSAGGIDMVGDCGELDGGGTTISNNTVNGAQIGQGIRLDVCAGHPSSLGGRHSITGNTVANTRLGLHVEAGSSGIFTFNTVTNSGVLSCESRARGASGDENIGLEFISNIFDKAGWNICRFIESTTTGASIGVKFNNNTLISTNTYPALLVQRNTSVSNTNEWLDNQFTLSGTGHRAICWNVPSTNNTLSCPTGATLYTDTQLDTFATDTGNGGNENPAGEVVATPSNVTFGIIP